MQIQTQMTTKNLSLVDLYCHEDFPILQSQLNHDEQGPENEGLDLILRKQEETHSVSRLWSSFLQDNAPLSVARRQAVDWLLGSTSYHSFSALTAFLSVTYLDQFLVGFLLQRSTSEGDHLKPWVVQLAAVACLSLAAKMEETHVPLLLDLQMGVESRYAFEPKSVQRMELVVLQMLDWRMSPVTPFSFLKDIATRMDSSRETEFVKLFGICVLSRVLVDPRVVRHRASVIAAAVAVHVMNLGDQQQFKYQLHKLLRFSRQEFDECHQYLQSTL